MPFLNNETDSVRDFLVLYGDLLIKTGQSGLRSALEALPSDRSQMSDWCNYWLHEQGKEQILKLFNVDSCAKITNSH